MIKSNNGNEVVYPGIDPIESTESENHRQVSILQIILKRGNLGPLKNSLCCFLNYENNEVMLTSIGLPFCLTILHL